MLRDERCIMSALKIAEELRKKNDKLPIAGWHAEQRVALVEGFVQAIQCLR